MRYMLLIQNDPAAFATFGPDDFGTMMGEYLALNQLLHSTGEFVSGDSLESPETASTLRIRDGKSTITDGPFAETKEVLGGYYVVDVANLDRALEIAAMIPGARTGSVEVRPLAPLPG